MTRRDVQTAGLMRGAIQAAARHRWVVAWLTAAAVAEVVVKALGK